MCEFYHLLKKQNPMQQNLLFSVLVLLLLSCSPLPSAIPDLTHPVVSLLPGECLVDNDLKCVYSNSYGEGQYYCFRFSLNVETQYEVVEQGHYYSEVVPIRHRHRPTDSVFKQFGGNARRVKEQYDYIWNDLNFSQSTVFYNGEMTLVADKEFAGIPAGENLAGLLESRSFPDDKPIIHLEPFNSDSLEMLLLAPINRIVLFGPSNNQDDYLASEAEYIDVDKTALLVFFMPIQDYECVSETVSFQLSIPIRSAQYLTWINDRVSNENAQINWKEDILTCQFSSNIGLRKKSQ